jgi:asparagine N-glycosylation enzyme membrane subunit Stt3
MVWLVFPLLELSRQNSSTQPPLTIPRVFMASVISLLLALITFVPETGETIPHGLVSGLLVVCIIIQTVLIFVTETTSLALRVIPAVIMSIFAALMASSMIPNIPGEPYLYLGLGQVLFLPTVLIFWMVAAFLPYSKALGRDMHPDAHAFQK